MEINEEEEREHITQAKPSGLIAPGLPILLGQPLPPDKLNASLPDYRPKICIILDFYLKIKNAPMQMNVVDSLFSAPELNMLAQLINNTGLSNPAIKTIEKMMKRLYINDVEELFAQCDVKKIANNTAQILTPLTRLNVRIYKIKRLIKQRVACYKVAGNHIAFVHEQIRLMRFNKISSGMSLTISKIHVAHAKQFEAREHKRCTIS